ncbi:MAG: hypothetical protein IKQ45_00790 [Clostridia bacterium]|nr:hypothetical protein [Clostridia bacterium]
MNEMTLSILASNIERAVPESRCQVLPAQNQIVVRFDSRPDVELSLLTPMQQRELQGGSLDPDEYSEMLFTLRRIANAQ